MNPIGVLLPIGCVVLAVTSSWLLVRHYGKPQAMGRFAEIDGLRGYLALAVFISHTAVWYFYLRSGRWEVPPSNLYTHFGESSVMVFFMITAFLFHSKLLDAGRVPIDWTRLYVSRILRLFPLYLFAMTILFAIVAGLSGGKLRQPLHTLLWRGFEWLAFGVLGGHDLNGVQDTFVITAGVTWSLAYEWMLYLSLPALALLALSVPPMRYLVLCAIGLCAAAVLQPSPARLLAFAGGIAAAYLVRHEHVRKMAKTPAAALAAIGCTCLAFMLFPTAYSPLPILLLSIGFAIIACGNSLFGLLRTGSSRMLGDLSYGIYLLHGIVLFAVFRMGLGAHRAASLSPTEHCEVAMLCTPLLVFAAFATYRLIEAPCIHSVTEVTGWLCRRVRR